jgi:hypothetical protein
MYRAAICRYAHQDIYRVLGRDPLTEPLTPLELAVFTACVSEHVQAEWKPRAELGLPGAEES